MPKFLLNIILLLASTVVFGQVEFSANVTRGCAPLSIQLKDSTVGATIWEWDFGNGNTSVLSVNEERSVIYSTPGFYTVTLTINNTMVDSLIIEVVEDPIIDFTVSKVTSCPPLNVSITDQSSSSSTGIVAWAWDFGNGLSDTIKNPTVTYDNSGSYSLFVQITDSLGCQSDTVFLNYFSVKPSPTASFTGSNIIACEAPLSSDFNAVNSQGTGTIVYDWDFGDGSTGSGQSPTHDYVTEGTFDVSLIVNDDTGCPDTLEYKDFVGVESMEAGFDYIVSGCGPANVTFVDTSGPTPSNWNWSFVGGNITSSTIENPIVSYLNNGTYNVSLSVSNEAGCGDLINSSITIAAPPSALFGAVNTYSCSIPFSVPFSDLSSGATSWLWTFGDGTTSTERSPTHIYSSSGNYTVTLTVENKDGCSNTMTRNNYIEITPPEALFEVDLEEGCINLDVNFTDTSSSNENITKWEWDFGDGATSTLQNPSHTYSSEGKFDVSLIITNALGCIDTLIDVEKIQAGAQPSIAFSADITLTCSDTIIQFSNESVGGSEFEWDFGDGGISSLENPIHIYADTGFFDVKLIVNNFGCKDSLLKEKYIDILPPIALFLTNFNCNDSYTYMTRDLSIDAETWTWDFGDGFISNDSDSVSHTYDSAGIYQIFLTVTNGGCQDETSQTVIVAEPKAGFDVDTIQGCVPFTANFLDTSDQAIAWRWIFSDGGLSSGQDPIYVFTTPGFFDVTLAVTAANGCVDTVIRTNYVEAKGAKVLFSVDDASVCKGEDAFFNSLSTAADGIKEIMWYFGDGDSSSITNPIHPYDSAAFYDVTLKVIDNNDCAVSGTSYSFVGVGKPVASIFNGDIWECPNYQIQFLNSSNPGPTGAPLSYLWDFGDNITSTAGGFEYHTYTSSDSFLVTLYTESSDGCKDTAIILADIRLPNISIVASDSTDDCAPFLVQFTGITDVNGGSWEWSFGDSAVSFFQNPSHTYYYNGLFDVQAIYKAQGSDCEVPVLESDFINVTGPTGSYYFTPDTGACAPMEVTFFIETDRTTRIVGDFGGNGFDTSSVNFDSVITVMNTYTIGDTSTPSIIIYDAAQCAYALPLYDSVRVSNIPVSAGPDTIICIEDEIDLYVIALGTDPEKEITWYTDDTVLTVGLTKSIHVKPVGTTDYFVKVEDEVGCVVTKKIAIQVDTLVAEFGAATGYCPGDSVLLAIDTNAGNGLGGRLSFLWTPSLGISNDTILSPFASPVTSQTYTLKTNDTLGCSVSTIVQVDPYINPTVTLNELVLEICYGEFDQFVASGASSYMWLPKVGLDQDNFNSPTVNAKEIADDNPILEGDAFRNYDYLLIGTDEETGCKDSLEATVKVRALPLIIQPDDTSFCHGDSVSLSVNGEDNYVWFPYSGLSDSTGQTVVATPNLDEIYKIIGVDAFGCKDTSEEVFIDVHPLPLVDYIGGDTILIGMDVELENQEGDNGHEYAWDPIEALSFSDRSAVSSEPTETIQYIVSIGSVTTPSCVVYDTIDIVVYDEVIIAVPNAFSPNGDGENDELRAYAKGMGSIDFKIFNRWGQIVFETTDLTISWDGTFKNNGQTVPMDTYSYVIKGDDLLGELHVAKGQITILK